MSLMDALDASMPGVSPGVYDEADFRAISEITYKEAGIVLPTGKAMLVYSRLAPLVRDSNCATFGAYVIRIREDAAERQKAICALTTNHTFFYRESHHFEHFAQEVRPGYVQRLTSGGKIRLWSAGCSSGEETWSLLMTFLGADQSEGSAIARRDLRLLASDIATHAIAKARSGTYRTEDLKAVPEALRRVWTRSHGEDSTIAPEVQQLARFRALNLQGEWPMQGQFDTIFCRNVMIYFDNPTKERLVHRFAEKLAPGGWLYIGHSERVTGPALDLLTTQGPTIYRKRAA
ncbi:protein-glutamate O-methyltransferase CheR [Novosphingobium sp. ERN07]|uniref:CheR family methyltransferase n=1 Tax=Novosphingobium sp. ERN07 TaxID=2726187 RepID=UPI0014565245|nr:protein-glutamate O-methyltransferase CheR [Novosphingobium sp. ERN07]NLR71667.1 protein-glutamate O-methyltransferase CheR [Novosphingobium sp. ERN07]